MSDEQKKDEGGLECSKCGCRHFFTIKTTRQTRSIVRRKQCRHCGKRVRSTERIVEEDAA